MTKIYEFRLEIFGLPDFDENGGDSVISVIFHRISQIIELPQSTLYIYRKFTLDTPR